MTQEEKTPVRHLLSLSELGAESLSQLIARSVEFASARTGEDAPLKGKYIGIYFSKSSTRTRTSFTVGAMRLGARIVSFGPGDLQLSTGETIEDTARILSGYLDALVVRTNETQAEMDALASQDAMAIVNAMSAEEHPTQAIADLSTLLEKFGRLDDLHVLYVGEGNNTASALAYAVAQVPGMKLTLVTPKGYGLKDRTLEEAANLAQLHGSVVEHHHRIERLPSSVDAVYATRWQTMGAPKSDPGWEKIFEPFCVTPEMMAKVSKDSGTVFLHDLPAVRGADVLDQVLDGPQSLAWRQARHKLYSAMAVLEWCLTPKAVLVHDAHQKMGQAHSFQQTHR